MAEHDNTLAEPMKVRTNYSLLRRYTARLLALVVFYITALWFFWAAILNYGHWQEFWSVLFLGVFGPLLLGYIGWRLWRSPVKVACPGCGTKGPAAMEDEIVRCAECDALYEGNKWHNWLFDPEGNLPHHVFMNDAMSQIVVPQGRALCLICHRATTQIISFYAMDDQSETVWAPVCDQCLAEESPSPADKELLREHINSQPCDWH